MSENWKKKRVPWHFVLGIAGGMLVFALVIFWGQQRDMKALKEQQESQRIVELKVQQQRSDKEKELKMADDPDYLAQLARESGYLLPGEIRFVVTNLDELLENGGDAEMEVAEEGL